MSKLRGPPSRSRPEGGAWPPLAAVRRNRVIRQLRARPRLFLAAGVAVAVGLLLPDVWVGRAVTRWILAWNAGACLYLVLAGWMMVHASQAQMARRAQQQSEGARTILLLVVLSALATLGAIVAELSVAKDLHGASRIVHNVLATTTILTSSAFTQVMYALHYAHEYYAAVMRGEPGGLEFPGTPHPDYLDFAYFSAVIGTSGQTADVSIVGRGLRRVGLVHCVLAFLFNTSLIALMINVASGLL